MSFKRKQRQDDNQGPSKRPRTNLVSVLLEQNLEPGSPLKKDIRRVLRSFTKEDKDYRGLLQNFLPKAQRGHTAEVAAFCLFVQQRQVRLEILENQVCCWWIFWLFFFLNSNYNENRLQDNTEAN